MYDTVGNSTTTYRAPDRKALDRFGAKYHIGRVTGELFKISVNSDLRAHEPRLTITPWCGGKFIYRTEVSIGAWLFGSNVHLPSVEDIPYFIERLADFAGERTGARIDPWSSRVARLDVTRDFRADPSVVPIIIDGYRNFRLPRRNTTLINGTTVNFDSKGKKFARRTTIYSKFDQLQADGAVDAEIEAARGIIRVEDRRMINQSVAEMAKSLKLPDHTCKHILTERVHFTVMDRLVNTLGICAALNRQPGRIPNLYSDLGPVRGGRIISHLALEATIGKDYYRDCRYNTSQRTAKERSAEALRYGLVRLE